MPIRKMQASAIASALIVLLLVTGPLCAQAKPDVQLRLLAEGVWLHTSYYTYPSGHTFPSNGLVIRDGDELTLVDTAWGEYQTAALLKVIASEVKLPVTKALVTHSHGDRVAGVDVLKAHGIKVFAHPLTQQLTLEYGLPVPDNTFQSLAEPGATVAFGKLTVLFPGAAHAMDNLMVWLPAERILFAGCAVRAIASNSAGNTTHGDTRSWLDVLKDVGRRYKSAEIVVPGHGEPGGIELISHTEGLVKKVAQ